jgi:secondary thiamine-phosphate synthase enzyme
MHFRDEIEVTTHRLITDLTSQLKDMAQAWGGSGLINVFSRHTTACVRVIENEILHVTDVRHALDHMFPKDKPENGRYNHDLISIREGVGRDERINGYSHMRALLFNTSETIPVVDGKLDIGKWQSVVMVELDATPVRGRTIVVTGMLENND